jgi:sugar phosphate isomerase/epimerase
MTEFSFQLYSARNFPPIPAFFPRLATLGYAQVEGFGGLYADATELAANLKKVGLSMTTGHFSLDQLKDTDKARKTAETLGVRTLFCPAIPREDRNQSENKWVELAETLAGLAEVYQNAGFGFGWHNHDFEFAPTESGKLPMDIILDRAPTLDWEVDIAWLVKGGQTPETWLDRYGSRITAIHVKDLAAPGQSLNEDGWADVGHGTLDWQSLYAKIRAKTKATYFVMEHDNPSDLERFATRSIATAKGWR